MPQSLIPQDFGEWIELAIITAAFAALIGGGMRNWKKADAVGKREGLANILELISICVIIATAVIWLIPAAHALSRNSMIVSLIAGLASGIFLGLRLIHKHQTAADQRKTLFSKRPLNAEEKIAAWIAVVLWIFLFSMVFG